MYYARSVHAGTHTSLSDAIERAGVSAQRQAVIDAVAEANNQSFKNTRMYHKDEVREVKLAVENEAERREEQGRDFDADERAEYARKIAEMKRRTREREIRHREEARKMHTARFLEADTFFDGARRAAKEGFDVVGRVEFTEEERELLTRELVAAQTMIRLAMLRVAGDSGTDWDDELARLEQKLQWG